MIYIGPSVMKNNVVSTKKKNKKKSIIPPERTATPTTTVIYLFIYLFLILTCNHRVMVEATDYGTLSGDRVLHLSPARICPRAVCQVRVVVPFLLLVSLFCGHHLVQEPCTLRGHHAGSSSLSSILPLLFFPFFPAFISSAVRVLTKEN
jgi:hypothetical protein